MIDKTEYMHAAGFCAYFAEKETRPSGEKLLRVWDSEKYRVATAEDMKRYFEYLYILNARGVEARYRHSVETDKVKLAPDFDAGRAAACTAWNEWQRTGNENIKNLLYGLHMFLHSALYQICEDDNAEKSAKEFIFQLYDGIIGILSHLDAMTPEGCKFWGSFDLE